MTSANALIPNSFQHPNIYIDRLSYYLTPAEEKVLNKAIREIYGWQNRVASRQARISVSVFTDGKRNEAGDILCLGCGLSSQAVRDALDALDEYGILRKVGKPTHQGQLYEIQDNEKLINWDGLAARKQAADEQNRARTQRARTHKGATGSTGPVLSDITPNVGQHDLVLSDITHLVLSDSNKETQETQLETHVGRQQTTASRPGGKSERRAKPGAKKKQEPLHEAIVVFRANAGRYPSKSWYVDIVSAVGTEQANLEFWGRVVKQYVGFGWNPTNVSRMLEYYGRHELPTMDNRGGAGKQQAGAVPQTTVKGI